MATLLSKASMTPRIPDRRHQIHAGNNGLRTNRLKCYAQNPTPSDGANSSSPAKQESEPDNALLKLAWYGSEMLGIAASFFRSPPPTSAAEDSLLASTIQVPSIGRPWLPRLKTISRDLTSSQET